MDVVGPARLGRRRLLGAVGGGVFFLLTGCRGKPPVLKKPPVGTGKTKWYDKAPAEVGQEIAEEVLANELADLLDGGSAPNTRVGCPSGYSRDCGGYCCPSADICCGTKYCGYYCGNGRCCPSGSVCCNGKCCATSCCEGTSTCCPHHPDDAYCCPGGGCCPRGQDCCAGGCCGADQKCCGRSCCSRDSVCCAGGCCKPGSVCCDGRCYPSICRDTNTCCAYAPGDATCCPNGGCCPRGTRCCNGGCCRA